MRHSEAMFNGGAVAAAAPPGNGKGKGTGKGTGKGKVGSRGGDGGDDVGRGVAVSAIGSAKGSGSGSGKANSRTDGRLPARVYTMPFRKEAMALPDCAGEDTVLLGLVRMATAPWRLELLPGADVQPPAGVPFVRCRLCDDTSVFPSLTHPVFHAVPVK